MAEFSTRDPARADFWDERFAKGFIPWDVHGVPPAFAQWLEQEHTSLGRRVLVPGCGSAYEVALLDAAGFDVMAIDYSAAAVERARGVLGVELAQRVLRQADFFALDAAPFDWIYERALLAALPLAQWPHWAAAMARLLRPGGRLVGYFALDEAPAMPRRGPPFVATRAELDALLQDFHCENCVPVAREHSVPAFAGREYWMCWQRGPRSGVSEATTLKRNQP
jgi:SAM-dependent methyltransferase